MATTFRDRRFSRVLLTLALTTVGTAPALAASSGTLADELNRLLTSPKVGKMRVGAQIIALDGQPRIIAELNSREPLKPASNQKVLTTAAALYLLPEDFRFRTVLACRGNDLILIGAGDPAIGDPELAHDRKETVNTLFHRWAEKLKAAGITQIKGNLLFDDFIFDQQFLHPSWADEFKDQLLRWYCAPIGGLSFNDNCIDIIVRPASAVGAPADVTIVPSTPYIQVSNSCKTAKKGEPAVRRTSGNPITVSVSGVCSRPGDPNNPLSITAVDPGMLCASALRTVLAAEGISVAGETRRQRVRAADNSIPRDLQVVAVAEQDLSDILLRCNRNSQNMFAETLMKALGAYAGTNADKPRVGSYETGRAVLAAFLKRLKLDADKCQFEDGSGLSHSNRLTASVLAGVLANMDRHPRRKEWIDSLATPGDRDATLKRRMKELNGKVFAKTGHISGVSSLSGYVFGPDNRRYAFSVICNNRNGYSEALEDDICRKLATWTGPRTSAE